MKVYRNIFREFRDKTIVASVHRLHLLPMFDKILLFNGGRIIASGSFADLLANSPEFQELWAQYNTEKKETVYILAGLLLPAFLYTLNFVNHNFLPIANWAPFL